MKISFYNRSVNIQKKRAGVTLNEEVIKARERILKSRVPTRQSSHMTNIYPNWAQIAQTTVQNMSLKYVLMFIVFGGFC